MRSSTIIYLLFFLVLAGAYYYLNNRDQPADISLTLEPTTELKYLFTEKDGTPTSVHIESKRGEVVEIARDADNAWVITQPQEAKADQGSAEAAASQVTTMQILDTIPDVDLDVVGLSDPEYTMTIKFNGDVERNVEIGVITPTESGYYVRNANGDIVIISRSSVDALLGLLTNLPYLETPTPSPIPTETPLPPTPEPARPSNETPTP